MIPTNAPSLDSMKKLFKFSSSSHLNGGGVVPPFLPLPHHLVALVNGNNSTSTRLQAARTGILRADISGDSAHDSKYVGEDNFEKPLPNLLHRVKDSIGGSMKRLYKARSDLQQMVMNKDGNAYASPNYNNYM